MAWLSYKYKLTRYALLAYTSYKYKLTLCIYRCITCINCTWVTNRKKESLSLRNSLYEFCSDKRQNDWEVFLPTTTRFLHRVVFLFLVQFLLTTESEQIDIYTYATHPQEPLILIPFDMIAEFLGPLPKRSSRPRLPTDSDKQNQNRVHSHLRILWRY